MYSFIAVLLSAALFLGATGRVASTDRLAVEAQTLTKQAEDAAALADCIGGDYRESLLNLGKKLLSDGVPTDEDANLRAALDKVEGKPACIERAPELSHDPDTIISRGPLAQRDALRSDHSVMIGNASGFKASDSPYITLLGNASGQAITNAPSSVVVGASAGRYAKKANHAIMLGASSGYSAENIDYTMLIGYAAGRYVKGNQYSFVAGYAAGEYANGSHESVMLGSFAGYESALAPYSIMIGHQAGGYASGAEFSQFVGPRAGKSARNTARSVMIGVGAGEFTANSTDLVLIGNEAVGEPGIKNATAIGNAAIASRSNQVVIGNSDVEETRLHGTVSVDQICVGKTCLDEQKLAALLRLIEK